MDLALFLAFGDFGNLGQRAVESPVKVLEILTIDPVRTLEIIVPEKISNIAQAHHSSRFDSKASFQDGARNCEGDCCTLNKK